ncbi:MAG TPA: anti-sigma factor, partial [Candidatus Nanopelagicales bacterium]|nr:anti-sigma factor [Candidatus Nanopelagicales bacterium]
ELAELSATAAELGAAAELAAPADLRRRVLAQVATTAQLPPEQAPGERPEPTVVVALRRRRPMATWLLAAAAAVLAVAVVGVGWRAATLSGDLSTAQASAREVAAVLTAPDARTVSGQTTDGARGAVVTSSSLNQSVVLADGITPAPEGKVYQLWYLTAAGAATSAGFLDPGPDGRAVVTLTGSADAAAAVGLTLEPAGGSSTPTTTPILALQI